MPRNNILTMHELEINPWTITKKSDRGISWLDISYHNISIKVYKMMAPIIEIGDGRDATRLNFTNHSRSINSHRILERLLSSGHSSFNDETAMLKYMPLNKKQLREFARSYISSKTLRSQVIGRLLLGTSNGFHVDQIKTMTKAQHTRLAVLIDRLVKDFAEGKIA